MTAEDDGLLDEATSREDLRATLGRIGWCWIFVVLGPSLTIFKGIRIQPVLWIAAPVLLHALRQLRVVMPAASRRWVDRCFGIGLGAFAAALAAGFIDGPLRDIGDTAWGFGMLFGLTSFCMAMVLLARDHQADTLAVRWQRSARLTAAVTIVLLIGVAAVAASRLVDGRPLFDPIELGGWEGWALIAVGSLLSVAPLFSAAHSMAVTRLWLDAQQEPEAHRDR